MNKKVDWLVKYKAAYWEIIQCYTHSIFLVPFQCSIEEIHGNVLVLIKPLNDKRLEPPKKEKASIIEGSFFGIYLSGSLYESKSEAEAFLFKHFRGTTEFKGDQWKLIVVNSKRYPEKP